MRSIEIRNRGERVQTNAPCLCFWELKHKGYKLSWAGTWYNELVQCRLDRSVANQAWFDMFRQASASYLKRVCSDHSPVLTHLVDQIWRRKATFKYDQRWIKKEGFSESVTRSWQQSNGQVRLMDKLARCRKSIS